MTDERRKILQGEYVPLELANACMQKLATESRNLWLEVAPQLRRELQAKFPVFADRQNWPKLEDAIEKVIHSFLENFSKTPVELPKVTGRTVSPPRRQTSIDVPEPAGETQP